MAKDPSKDAATRAVKRAGSGGGGGVTDHGGLTGLGDDDHTQYTLVDGTRAFSGDVDLGGNALTNATVAGGQLDANTVTDAKLSDMSTNTIKGRISAPGDPQNLTPSQVRSMINVEDGATADQTGAEIKTAYEGEPNTNAFTDAEQSKLSGIESGATNTGDPLADADQTVTAARTVDGAFRVQIAPATGTYTATLSATPTDGTHGARIIASAVDTGTAAASFEVVPAAIDLKFPLGSALALDSSAGTAGEVLVTNGAGAAPTWGGVAVVASGTAPSNTNVVWYHTTDRALYTYDSTLSEWLGEEQTFYASRIASAITANLILENARLPLIPSTRAGFIFPWNAKVTGWAWSVGTGTTVAANGRILRMGKYDTSAGSYNGTFYNSPQASAWTDVLETGLDLDFDAQDRMGLVAIAGSGTTDMTDPHCTVTFRRRPS